MYEKFSITIVKFDIGVVCHLCKICWCYLQKTYMLSIYFTTVKQKRSYYNDRS